MFISIDSDAPDGIHPMKYLMGGRIDTGYIGFLPIFLPIPLTLDICWSHHLYQENFPRCSDMRLEDQLP